MGSTRPLSDWPSLYLWSTLAAINRGIQLYRTLGLDGRLIAQCHQPMPVYSRNYDAAMAAKMLEPGDLADFRAIRQALTRHAPVPSSADFFYYALLDDFDARHDCCPWLASGAYLGSNGQITGCCFMKGPEHALGDPS